MADRIDDHQRTLEQHALRNVRGLVDKMETLEETERRTQKKLVAWILMGVAAVAVVVGAAVWHGGQKPGEAVVIVPANAPPIKPGP